MFELYTTILTLSSFIIFTRVLWRDKELKLTGKDALTISGVVHIIFILFFCIALYEMKKIGLYV